MLRSERKTLMRKKIGDDTVERKKMGSSRQPLPGKKKRAGTRVWDEEPRRKYTGVSKTGSGKYCSVITDPFKKKTIWLGTFNTPEQASQAYLAKKAEFQASKGPQLEWVEVISEEDEEKHTDGHESSDHQTLEASEPPHPSSSSSMPVQPVEAHHAASETQPEASTLPSEDIQSWISVTGKQLVAVESGSFNGGGAVGFLISDRKLQSGSSAFLPLVDNHGFLLGMFSELDHWNNLAHW